MAPKAVINRIADLIREEQLDGPDVHDIAVSVDLGEPEFLWAGLGLWRCLRAVVRRYGADPFDVINEACVARLGWPVAS